MKSFKHHNKASEHPKMVILQAKHGNIAYVFFFAMLGTVLKHKERQLDLSDEIVCDDFIFGFSNMLGITQEEYNNILNSCLRHGLFNKDLYLNHSILKPEPIEGIWRY